METSRQQGTSAGSNNDRTRSQLAGPNAATLTAGFEVEATKGWSGPVRMRAAPAGYDLFRYLGGGGMGEVYVAREHAAERVVAIKFLRPTSNASLRERFLNEVRALGRINHPHVVRMISVELERSDPFYTMEYATAGTIADRIKAEGPFPPDEAARIGVQLAGALAAAHEAEILHRDIKPSNVIVTADGVAKLSDFGLAKLMDADDDLTRTTQAIGTPAFMPPEQISRKFGGLGPATDVYGLGATLYAMLTGKAPFEGDSNEDVISKVRSDAPVRPRALRNEVPKGLEAVVLKCLQKRPADRYASTDELAKDLELHLAGKKPEAPPYTPFRRVFDGMRRHRVSLAGAISILLGAIALGSLLPERSARSLESRPLVRVDSEPALRERLAAGERVQIIGESEVPEWLRDNWLTTPTGLATSPAADGACSYESIRTSLLALVRDPGTENFQLTAQIKLVEPGRLPPGVNKPEDLPSAGLFFSVVKARSGSAEAHAFLAGAMLDYLPPTVVQEGIPGTVLMRSGLVLQTGGRQQSPMSSRLPPLRFTPSETLPAPWRVFQLQSTSHRIRLLWAESPDAPLRLVAELNRQQIDEHLADRQKWLDDFQPGLGLKLPAWAPPVTVGIWNHASAIGLRNVVIEPLH